MVSLFFTQTKRDVPDLPSEPSAVGPNLKGVVHIEVQDLRKGGIGVGLFCNICMLVFQDLYMLVYQGYCVCMLV